MLPSSAVDFVFSLLELIEIVILAWACFGTFWTSLSNFWTYFVWLRITDEGSVPEMRIWSILLIQSDLKWCIHLSRSLFLCFKLLSECHCWWTRESPRAHVAKFCGRLRLIRSVLGASQFSVFKLIEIVILWVNYTIPLSLLALACFGTFWISLSNLWTYFVWLRITDEGSVPETHIWSILLIQSDLKWCIHLSRSLFKHRKLWCSQHATDQEKPSSAVDFGWSVAFWEHHNFLY